MRQILFVTTKSYGIRAKLDEFKTSRRKIKGIRAVFLNDKNGTLVKGVSVTDDSKVMLLTKKGQCGLFDINQIKLRKRALSGIRLMTLEKDDEVVDVLAV